MKTAILSTIISFLSIPCFAISNLEVKQAFSKELRVVDLQGFDLTIDSEHFVNVEFQIVQGELSVLDIDGTSDELKSVVKNEIKQIQLDPMCCEGESYIYQVRFKQE